MTPAQLLRETKSDRVMFVYQKHTKKKVLFLGVRWQLAERTLRYFGWICLL